MEIYSLVIVELVFEGYVLVKPYQQGGEEEVEDIKVVDESENEKYEKSECEYNYVQTRFLLRGFITHGQG